MCSKGRCSFRTAAYPGVEKVIDVVKKVIDVVKKVIDVVKKVIDVVKKVIDVVKKVIDEVQEVTDVVREAIAVVKNPVYALPLLIRRRSSSVEILPLISVPSSKLSAKSRLC